MHIAIQKDWDEAKQAEMREENEKIRTEREKRANEAADRYACFKRDLMGAPIRKAMKIIIDKKKEQFKSCQIDYRKDERYWCFGDSSNVSVVFELNFETKTD